MTLYHGSYKEILLPDLEHTRKNVDFGPGFYTTPIYDQAANWCARFRRRGLDSVISCYSFDEAVCEQLQVLRFESYSEEWLNFVTTCRLEQDHSEYDLVVGGVADDKVFNTVELYFDGLIDRMEAIRRLQYERPNLQVVFRTDRAITNLHFVRSEKI